MVLTFCFSHDVSPALVIAWACFQNPCAHSSQPCCTSQAGCSGRTTAIATFGKHIVHTMLHGLLQGKMDPAQEFWTIDPEGSPMFVRVVSQPDSGESCKWLMLAHPGASPPSSDHLW